MDKFVYSINTLSFFGIPIIIGVYVYIFLRRLGQSRLDGFYDAAKFVGLAFLLIFIAGNLLNMVTDNNLGMFSNNYFAIAPILTAAALLAWLPKHLPRLVEKLRKEELQEIKEREHRKRNPNAYDFENIEKLVIAALLAALGIQVFVAGKTNIIDLIAGTIGVGIVLSIASYVVPFLIAGVYWLLKKKLVPGFSLLVWVSFASIAFLLATTLTGNFL